VLVGRKVELYVLVKVGLQINTTKTKMLTQSRSDNPMEPNIIIGEQRIDTVQHFTCLGTIITSNCNKMEEIQGRICRANKSYYTLLLMLKSKYIH
jgi:hypothetical protein